MKEIQLNKQGKNKGKYVALVDDEDFERVNKLNWHANKSDNKFYARTNIRVNGKRTCMKMHKFIIDGIEIDHVDSNGLNNQKHNLRSCTHHQNMMNKSPHINCTSKYKGVSWKVKINKWQCQISINGNVIYLGVYTNEIDAAKEYDKKAKELFGEFAYLNFK